MHMLAIGKRIASPIAQNATGLLASGFGHVCGQGCLGFLLCQLIGTLAHLDEMVLACCLVVEDFLGLSTEGGVRFLAEGQVVVLNLQPASTQVSSCSYLWPKELVEAIYGVEPAWRPKMRGVSIDIN